MSFRPALLCLLRLMILVGAVLGFAPAVQAATLEEALTVLRRAWLAMASGDFIVRVTHSS